MYFSIPLKKSNIYHPLSLLLSTPAVIPFKFVLQPLFVHSLGAQPCVLHIETYYPLLNNYHLHPTSPCVSLPPIPSHYLHWPVISEPSMSFRFINILTLFALSLCSYFFTHVVHELYALIRTCCPSYFVSILAIIAVISSSTDLRPSFN